MKIKSFWKSHLRCDGTIDRLPFALIGIVAFGIKHNLDVLVATRGYGRHWDLFRYLMPGDQPLRVIAQNPSETHLFLSLLALALPFVGVGVVLTVHRLRSIGLPLWLAAFFFVPLVNLLFFFLLSVLPARGPRTSPQPSLGSAAGSLFNRLLPERPMESAVISSLLIAAVGALLAVLSTNLLSNYGWGLFVGLPFCLGLLGAVLHGARHPRSRKECLSVAVLSVFFTGMTLLAVAAEGLVCLAMALPIALPLAILGGLVGHAIQSSTRDRHAAQTSSFLVFFCLPLVMYFESFQAHPPSLLMVRSAVIVKAPPKTVWRQLVAFSEITEPKEWLFRLGIACPVRAELRGHGPGAVRRCVFTTGPFVEPIQVWDEPRLLRFTVTAEPDPLIEMSFYQNLRPPHLDNYFRSEKGEFLLTDLGDGRTLLEGTTWYRDSVWPADYWKLWSDFIIRRIHQRVLRHIQHAAEQESEPATRR
jgi:hypothetical protein